MTERFPVPRPITTEEREFVATVEESMRPAFLEAVGREFGPYGRPTDEVVEQMSAAAPGHRLQTAVEANMSRSTHFDALPAEERSAVAEQAALVTAKRIDARLTVQAADSRLGELVGKGADRLLRGEYEKVAQEAGGEVGLVLGGAINRARFVHQLAETQRHAAAGVTPPGRRPESRTATSTPDTPTTKPADRTRPNRPQPHTRG
ncbi:hypothetical protein [Kribbella speibonae]|uniref:Uncharacterized protein n=1 Tax=Kribbella speibonae TaxID=1572660 RepID=A0A4R0IYE6_9ACTN|nr:hypothetical protein [Kribbella speibonae]TCC37980.1 hypothetical protein E0H92_16070 [Kribbella speibonae]